MSVAEDAGAELGKQPPGSHPDAVARSRFSVPPERRADVLIAALLASATFFVHDLGYMLTTPLWNDEFWVAISTKLPLHDLLRVIASSPPGWTLMLRMVPFGYPEGIRIVPLLFSALTVLVAYIYARTLSWPSLLLARIAGVLAGAAALLIPSSLARNDLKQYTADAFVTLVALCLVSRVESSWSGSKWSRRVAELAAFLAVGFLFSTAAIILGAATFGAVFLAAVLRRDWRKLVPIALIGAACMACLLLTYLVVYRPGAPDALTEYWASYYVPVADGWAASWDFLVDAQERMVRWLGMGPFVLVAGLVVAGVTSLVLMRRFSSAVVVPLLVVLMIALSAARRYPLFDTRTSHFLTVALAVTAAIGVAGLCALAARLHPAVAVTVAVVFSAAFIISPDVSGHLRWHSVPKEDLDTPTTFIADHLQPGDTIAVPMLSSWGFAYYWPHGEPAIAPVTSNLQQFITVFPDQPNIVVATDGQPAGIDDVMTRAVALATGPDGNGRIWFPHEHIKPPELAGYQAWMESHGIGSTTAVPRTLDLLTVQAGP